MNTIKETRDKSFLTQKYLKIIPYIFHFFTFSFLGWIMETIYCSIPAGEIVERGFLFSPICPIYGFGALTLILYFDTHTQKRNYIKLFFQFICIFSFFEYITGFVFEVIFGIRWWDYSDSKYSINGRITLLNSFLWGVVTVIFARFIYPIVKAIREKLITKIPDIAQIIVATILLFIIFVDFTASSINYLL